MDEDDDSKLRPERVNNVALYSAGIDSDVSRRQILTSNVSPHTVRVQIFLMAVDPHHRYSNESERPNQDIYEDFKLNKTLWSPWCIYKNTQRCEGPGEHLKTMSTTPS